MWKRLKHPNIVPFKGVTLDPFQIVSDWMAGGDLTDYISLNPQANRINLVSPFLPRLQKRGLISLPVDRCRRGASLPAPSRGYPWRPQRSGFSIITSILCFVYRNFAAQHSC